MGLWDAPRSGKKRKWQPENIEVIAEKLDKDQRTYNSRQLLEILATLNQVHLSERQLRRILKKKQPLASVSRYTRAGVMCVNLTICF